MGAAFCFDAASGSAKRKSRRTCPYIRSVLFFETFLSFQDVTYFFCRIAKLRLHQFESV